MNMGQAITSCMRKYSTFSGRASRSEFWWFSLFYVLLSWGTQIAGYALASISLVLAVLPLVVTLVLLLPQLAVACRRLHDIGRSGWWQLLILTGIGFILLVIWWVRPSQEEENRYGVPAG